MMPYKTSTDYERMVDLLDAGETLVYKHYRSTRYWSQISGKRVSGRQMIYGESPKKWIESCKKCGTVYLDPEDCSGEVQRCVSR